ncbi:hypothetical protein KUU50_19990 [Pseudomonas aeruginosa]|nr:hypothetical protein [Pseudomonas aeruginosa]
MKHIRTRPYTPRTNGKAERFIQTSLREWALPAATTLQSSGQHTCYPGCITTTGTDCTPVSVTSHQSSELRFH